MSATLSDRASKYIGGWQRRSNISTEAEVCDALERAGVPVTAPLLDFHRTFAGYVFDCELEVAVLGLVHPDSYWRPPNEVDAWEPNPPNYPFWKVATADVNPTFWWMIDEQGTYFTAAAVRIASSFARYVEQLAFQVEFVERHPCWSGELSNSNSAKLLTEVLLPRLQKYRTPELSDACSQIFASSDFIVSVVPELNSFNASVKINTTPDLFADVVWGG